MNKTIHELQLHESIDIAEDTNVIRVPGGWLYTTHKTCSHPQTTLVPYNEEFNERLMSSLTSVDGDVYGY
jgi:hypothetical protein